MKLNPENPVPPEPLTILATDLRMVRRWLHHNGHEEDTLFARHNIDLAALDDIDTAIDSVSTSRGTLGSSTNRLGHAIASIATARENLAAAESRIRDVDVAFETADLTRNSILQQAATSVLAQANAQPQLALSLLG